MTATSTTAGSTGRTGTVLRNAKKKERPAPITRTAPKRNAAGHDLGSVELEPSVFGLEPHRAVLHQVVTAQLAGVRAGSHSTLTRAEARGGGAKPFRQKGTGRARQGSTRSPSMSGGGVALGPKPRSYAQRTPKKMVRLALLSALSDRADIGRILVVEDWEIDEPDTNAAATMLRKLKVSGSVLVVLAQDEITVALSFRNLPAARITTWAELQAHDVIRADWLLFSERTLPGTPDDFSGTHLFDEGPGPLPAAGGNAAGKKPAATATATGTTGATSTKAAAATTKKAAATKKADGATTKASGDTDVAAPAKARSTKRTKAADKPAPAETGEEGGDDA